MILDHLIVRQVFNQRDANPQPPERCAETFTAIFLDGVRVAPEPAAPRAPAGGRRRG
jgi:hypothetical protein